jgi:hypothetical protein
MGKAAKQTRTNRTITIDFQHEATYFQLLGDGKAFLEYVLAFILSLGFQLTHKVTRSCRCARTSSVLLENGADCCARFVRMR